MSSLNLTPDLVVVGTQAGIFLANMWVVNQFMLKPYLKLKEKQENSTIGNEGEADSLLKKAKELDDNIAIKLREAHKSAASFRQELKDSASAARASKLETATQKAKTFQLDMQSQIKANLAEESAKKAERIKEVKQQLLAAALQ